MGVVLTDNQYCEWAVLTVVEDGATASPQLKEVRVARGTVTSERLRE